jgi:L-amino acid N-acyltransferase YncA/ribonuclease HI
MTVTIREYKSSDAVSCRNIWNHVVEEANAFPQETGLSEDEADNFFKSQTYTGVACDADTNEVIGLYILHPNNIGRCGHIANASYAVADEVRGCHIGEKLVKNCLKKAKTLGFRVLQFNAVVAGNIHAIHLYERLGFIRLGRVPGGYRHKDGSYEDIFLFYYDLVGDPSEKDAETFACGPVRDDKSDKAVSQTDDPEGIISGPGIMTAYTDGSFQAENNVYGAGAVIFYNGKSKLLKGAGADPELAGMRNVAGEIMAAEMSFEEALKQGASELHIFYDYTGIEMWAAGGWKTNREGTRSYKQKFLEVSGKIKICFHKVSAHKGVKYNELADTLAGEAVKEYH